MSIRLFKLNQRGDTLIEVVIATVIIGIILFSAYNLSHQAFKLGQSARERSQATQLIQEQAEGLRALRDSAANWADFRTQIRATSPGNAPFHVQRNGSNWALASGGNWNPQAMNPELPNFYTVTITGNFAGVGEDQYKSVITIRWARFGGGPLEESRLYYNLTDQEIIVSGG